MNKKAILIPVAVLTTGALLLTGCGNNSAASASRRATEAARKTDTIVKRLDTYTDAHYKFPQSFQGTGFKMKGQDCFGGDCPPMNMYGQSTNNFYHRMDGMHRLAHDISETNTRKHGLIHEVRHEAQKARNLSNELRGRRIKNADWNGFNRAHTSLNANLRDLSKQRGKMTRDMRMLPNNKNINVDAMTNRYSTINNKLQTRKATLQNIHTDLQSMNAAMTTALATPKPQRTGMFQRKNNTTKHTAQKQAHTKTKRQDGMVYPQPTMTPKPGITFNQQQHQHALPVIEQSRAQMPQQANHMYSRKESKQRITPLPATLDGEQQRLQQESEKARLRSERQAQRIQERKMECVTPDCAPAEMTPQVHPRNHNSQPQVAHPHHAHHPSSQQHVTPRPGHPNNRSVAQPQVTPRTNAPDIHPHAHHPHTHPRRVATPQPQQTVTPKHETITAGQPQQYSRPAGHGQRGLGIPA